MKVTPLDIQQKQFSLKFRGFDIREVDAFLDIVASQFEELIKEINLLREESEKKDAVITENHEKEKILRETMISAQKLAEDIKTSSRKDGELIVSEAKLQAEKIIHSAHTRYADILNDISELKKLKSRLIASLKSMIDSHLKLLEAEEEEGQSPDKFEDKVTSLKNS